MDRRRLRSFIIMGGTFVAAPLYIVCGLTHVCFGHMLHPPYPVADWVMDATWVTGFLLGAVGTWRSDLPLRPWLTTAFVVLILTRLFAGGLFPLDLPVLAFVVATTGAALLFRRKPAM